MKDLNITTILDEMLTEIIKTESLLYIKSLASDSIEIDSKSKEN